MKSCLLAVATPQNHGFRGWGVYISEGKCPKDQRDRGCGRSLRIDDPLSPVTSPAEVSSPIKDVFCVNPGSQNGRDRTNCYTLANGRGAEDCVPLADSLGAGDTWGGRFGDFGTVPIVNGPCPVRPGGKPPAYFLANPQAREHGEARRQFCLHHTDGRCGYCFIAKKRGGILTKANCKASSADIDRVEEGDCTSMEGCSSDDGLPAVQLPPPGRLKTPDMYCLHYADGDCTTCSTGITGFDQRDCVAVAPGVVRVADGLCPRSNADGGCALSTAIDVPPIDEIDAYGWWPNAPRPSAPSEGADAASDATQSTPGGAAARR